MPQNNLGRVAFKFKGDYSPGTTYTKYDVVFDGESSYVSLVDANAGNLLTDATKWEYLAKGNALLSEQNALDIAKTRADLNEKADKKQGQWITPTLMNGVTEVTPVRYMKDSLGFVHLKGVCGNVTQAVPMFNLPSGYRVEQLSRFPGVTNNQFIRISIATSPDGDIIPDGIVNNGMCSIDNIIFRAKI